MTTPILDFVRSYAASGVSRLHMPGHKGRGALGCEQYDITEIAGADDLSCPEGIIQESERNAGKIFATRTTFYSTGGSSQCVKAMLLLASRRSASRVVLAARNAHKSFIHGCALLGLEPRWLGRGGAPLPSCRLSAEDIASAVDAMAEKPCAVYITSPAYLGGMAETAIIAQITRERGVPLLLDGAHGAYLDVLSAGHNNCQPDLWCASAHKTLGVLTGGAYLHVGRNALSDYEKDAKEALGVFGSSSPSYLVMASLDAANGRISDNFTDSLNFFIGKVEDLKRRLSGSGVPVAESDPLRITIAAHEAGYSGYELAAKLREHGCECEFADPDWLVMMLTPENDMRDFERISAAFADFSPRAPRQALTVPAPGEAVMTPREALLAAREIVPAGEAAGRVMASAAVTCPPAVPIAVMGERITAEQAELLLKYGITSVEVVI